MHTIITNRSRSLIIDLIALLILIVLALLLTLGVYRQPRNLSVMVNQASTTGDQAVPVQLQHFYGSEGTDQSYRWSDGLGSIAFPNPGGSTLVRLQLAAGPTQPVALSINTPHNTIDLELPAESRQYTFILPPENTPRIVLYLSSIPRFIAKDTRELGVVLGNMAISGGGLPPRLMLILLACAVAAGYAALRTTPLPRRLALLIVTGLLVALQATLATWGWLRPDMWILGPYLMITLGLATLALSTLTRVYATSATWPRVLVIGIIVCAALIPLYFYSVTGTLTRYIADDYCYATPTRDFGPIGLVAHMYRTWSGRYTSTFLIGLLATIGPASAPISPIVLIVMWLISLSWVVAEISVLLDLRHPRIAAILIAAPILTATLASTPNLFQSVYWQVGGQTYLAALIAALLYTAWMITTIRRHRALLPAALFSLLAGIAIAGFSESNTALNLAMLTLTLIGSTLLLNGPTRRATMAIVGAGLIGSLIGLALVASAPGNQTRQALLATPLTPPVAIWSAIQETISVMQYPYRLITQVPTESWIHSPLEIGRPLALAGTSIAIFVIALVSTSIGTPKAPLNLRYATFALLIIALLSGIIATANLTLGFYALGTRPPDRVFLASYFLIALGVAGSGIVCGRILPVRLRVLLPGLTLIVILALMMTIAGTAADTEQRRPRMQAYSAAWAQVDQQARRAAAQNQRTLRVSAAARQLDGLLWITSDPNYWSNICTAQYYRLDQIVSAAP